MKKVFSIISFLLMTSFSLSAFSLFTPLKERPACVSDQLAEILEQKDFESDKASIKELTKNLTTTEKQTIFDFYKSDGAIAALNNFALFYPSFGSGSFSQGDMAGGSLILVTDTICAGMEIAGSLALGLGMLDLFGITALPYTVLGWEAYDPARGTKLMLGGLISYGIGLTVSILADCVYGGLRPISYASRQNSALKEALGIYYTSSVNIEPLVDPWKQNIGLAVSMRM